MVSVSLEPATQEHVAHIAARTRQADRHELWASSMSSPQYAMSLGRSAGPAFTGLVDGVPVCMWGVVGQLIGRFGVPWMVCAEEVECRKVAVPFLRMGRTLLSHFSGDYDTLANYVDARNVKAIRWLGYMGFTIAPEPVIYGLLRLPFHRFEKRFR